MKKRCEWVNLNNKLSIDYHDKEWSKPSHNDRYLFELLILEMFQAGLSWEIVLNKREAFRKLLNNFDYQKISQYDSNKIKELLDNPKFIRNKRKIKALINNSQVFIDIQKEYGSFDKYIWSFTDNKIINNHNFLTTNSKLSDMISKDLKQKGMQFVGSIIIYSYLQAIGVINDHDINCCFK